MTDSTTRAAQPNYAARRMLVSAVVITAIVVAVSVVWQQFRGEDRPADATPIGWNAIAFVSTSNGEITVVDVDGAVVARYEAGARVTGVHAAGNRLALVHTDSVSVYDVTDGGDTDPHTVDLPQRSRTVTRLPTAHDRLLLAAGNRTGGPLSVIDATDAERYDLAELGEVRNPLLYTGTLRADPAGTTVAVADAGSFQTIVVGGIGAEGDEAEPIVHHFADQPLAVSDQLLATTQVVGGRADVSVHPLEGPPAAPVAMDIPAGGVIVDGRLVAVTTTGAVVAIRVGDRQPRQLATLAIPPDVTVTSVRPAANGTRIVVHADSYVAVLDNEGQLIAEHTGATGTSTPTTTATTRDTTPPTTPEPANDGEPATAGEPILPAHEWTCLPVSLGTRDAALIDLADGGELASLRNVTVTATSADGCTVLGTRGATHVVVGRDGRSTLGPAREAQISPDGRAVLRVLTSRDVELIPLDDELQPQDPIELDDVVPRARWTAAFVER